jgi:hypothetical protein
MFSLHNWRKNGGGGSMYTYVTKCKNNKVKLKKIKLLSYKYTHYPSREKKDNCWV